MKNNLPMQLAFEEAKKEIVKHINDVSNDYNLSYFLLKFIMDDIMGEVEIGKNKEYQSLKNKYEKEVSSNEQN